MKCLNCGANFETADFKCPFCGTENPKGMEWAKEEQSAKHKMEKTKSYIKKSLPLYVCDSICNIVLTIAGILTVILIILMNVNFDKKDKKIDHSKIDMVFMEECYQKKDFDTLLSYVNDNNIRYEREGRYKKYYEYIELQIEFSDVCKEMNHFYNEKQEDLEEDCEYGAVYQIINSCSDFLYIDYSYAYRDNEVELEPENQAIYARNKQFIFAFLKTRLRMTEEECNELSDHYWYGEEVFALVKELYERNGWRYEIDEN